MIGEGKQIPDDIRLFLRAVLMSSPGLKQPTLMNEYFEITREQLNFRDYGFNNLYEFLVSLEGEVTRIEFSPIHGENLIYAVPDKDKYLSKHAEKYANKKGSYIEGKSPEEILEWKKEHKWKVKSREKSKKTNNRTKKVSKVESKSIKVSTSINEWFDLRKLLPNAEGLFSLKVKSIGKCQRNDKSLVAALRSHFANYNILQIRIQNANPKFAIVSFAKYFSAYAAWKEKDCSNFNGCKIGIEPVGGAVTHASNTGIHKVIMTQMPKELLMSTLVAQFVKYPSLIYIDPHPREQYVVVGYLSKTSAEEASRKIKSIAVNNKTVSVDVRQLDEKPIHFTTFNSRVKANETKFLDPSKQNLETSPEIEIKDLAFHMFTKIHSKGLTLTEISDEIEFIITHAEDPCTFWGWIMNESNKILAEMEEKIPSIIREIQKKDSLPNNGDRGVALYKDEESESWYRCYALSADEEKDTVSVFFCDYGNCANVQKEDFLLIDEGIWSLPPQVFLFKFYDIDFHYDRNSARCIVGKKKIYELLHGHPMKAKVMKTPAYSEPHIIEIKDVRHVTDKDSVIIDDKIYDICCRSFEKPSETVAIEDSESKIDGKKKDLPQSLFDYDEDELVLGRLLEAYNPNLLFLTLDDVKTFSTLEIMLEEAILHAPVEIQKGDVLILCTSGQKRRVLILQLMKTMYNAMVLHVDYGVIEWTSLHNLYQLPIYLQSVRFQARCASLAGIDCSEKMSEAVEFIKGKSKIVLKANVLRESSIGKISVELFDVNSSISLNKEMVEKQLAVRVYHEVGDTDEEFSSFVIPVVVKDHISRKPKTLQPLDTDPWIAYCQDFGRNLPLRDSISHKELVSSLASLNTNSFTSHDHKSMSDCNRDTPQSKDIPSLMNIQTCIDPSYWEGNHSKILTKTDSEGYRPTSVNDSFEKRERCSIKALEPDALYLPPDIDVTNKLNLTSLMNIQTSFDNSCWEGNCSKISTKTCSEGYQPTSVNDSSIEKKDRCCIKVLEPNALYPPTDIDETNKLNLHQTEDIRKKWITEKNTLLKIKDKLEMAMQMSSEELTSYYKEIKKEKLRLRYNLKVSKALSEKLEAEYQDIVKEEIHILSLV